MRGRKIPSTVVRPNFMCPQPERGRNLATPSAEARPKTHPLPKRGRKVPSALGEAVLRQLCCWQPTTKQTQWLRFESCWSPPLGTVSRQQHSLPEHPTGVEPKLEPGENFTHPLMHRWSWGSSLQSFLSSCFRIFFPILTRAFPSSSG